MKKIILVVLIFIGLKAGAQDLIIKLDKTEIKSKVLEIADDIIKYKKFEKLDGPTYSIKKGEVFMIIYKDGTKEYMEQSEPANSSTSNNSNNSSSSSSNKPATATFSAVKSSGNKSNSKAVNGNYQWGAGATLGLPMGTFGDAYSIGFGANLEVSKLYSESLLGFANVGYISFAGNSIDIGGGDTYTPPSAGFITILAGAKYRSGKSDIGGGLGYASSDGGSGLMFSPCYTYNYSSKIAISGNYSSISANGGSMSFFSVGFLYKW